MSYESTFCQLLLTLAYELPVVRCRHTRYAWPLRVTKVHVIQPELFRVALGPLELIEQGPGRVGLHIHAVKYDC